MDAEIEAIIRDEVGFDVPDPEDQILGGFDVAAKRITDLVAEKVDAILARIGENKAATNRNDAWDRGYCAGLGHVQNMIIETLPRSGS